MTYPAEQFRAWMDERGLSAADVAADMRSEEQTIRKWRSQGVPHRRKSHVERYMREWDQPRREISEAEIEAFKATDSILLNPEPEQYDRWDRASRRDKAETLKDWIYTGLDRLAEQESANRTKPADTQATKAPETEQPTNIFELPFLGAVAAGEPVSAPLNETLVVPREYAPGHFVVEINGRSGEPEFQDGERWVIDGRDCYTPKKGKPCIVSDGYGSYLKKWNKSRGVFESINPAFPDVLPLEEAKLQGYPVERI